MVVTLGFLDLSFLELGQGTLLIDGQTDGQTDTGPHFIMPLPMEVVGIKIKRRHRKVTNNVAIV